MKSNDIRSTFIQYFKKQGHTLVPSSPLIPENDPTLLFANAGMNQFKNAFLGAEKRPYTRAVSVQKCVRAGGKHNDLDNVGFTARHHTFFEMLGNFSFGDYFKKDAIHFAWELLTKEFGIPKEKLYITVFETDDEAAEIWHKQEGVPRERIFRFGEKDNFWRMGDTGPCGPCSEIFYDHGEHAGHEKDPFKGIAAGEDRYVEIWNLVFMQFFEKAPGQMDPLPKPSVDTGAGLERVTAALQGKLNNYDTDLFWPMIVRSAEIAKKTELLKLIERLNQEGIRAKLSEHEGKLVAALRVVADHTRACSLLLADGAQPSNEGRGYVLRRILRRAIRFSQLLSGQYAFLPEIAQVFIKEMGEVYPELKHRKSHILSTISEEQLRFMQTLGTGTEILNQELKKYAKNKTLPGSVLFKLYDTYGFPADLTSLIAAEHGLSVDEAGFEKEMSAAREKARGSWKAKSFDQDQAHLTELASTQKPTQFTGYENLKDTATILSLSDGNKSVNTLEAGQSGIVILDRSPFYAEGGGQVGDQGEIGSSHVSSTKKIGEVHLHFVELQSGKLKVGDQVTAQVGGLRRNTMSNHSATHLLHAALRNTLGSTVTQAGSLVDEQKLRFDFTFNRGLSGEEIQTIENLVNEEIAKANPVVPTLMSYKKALDSGAMALFGEKYGEEVRVLKMGDFSVELCGGTHVSNTAQIRLFKIVSESGVSSGVRRIEALTGEVALEYLLKNARENQKARQLLGINEAWQTYLQSSKESSEAIEALRQNIKDLEKKLKSGMGSQINIDQLLSSAHALEGGARAVIAAVELDDRELLAKISDQLRDKLKSGVVILAGKGEAQHPLFVSVTKDLTSRLNAGSLLKQLAQALGGKGGGRADFAQGSIAERDQLQDKAVGLLKPH